MTADPSPFLIVEDSSDQDVPVFRVSREDYFTAAAVRVTDSDGDSVRVFVPRGTDPGIVAVRVEPTEGHEATAYAPARFLAEEILGLIGETAADPEPLIPPQVVSDEAAAVIASIREAGSARIPDGSPAEEGLRVTDSDGDEARVEPALSLHYGAAAYLLASEAGAYLTAAQARDFAAILTAAADRAEGVAL